MTSQARLDRDRLVEEAQAATGHDDLGADSWQEPLDILVGSLRDEGDLHELGVDIAADDLVTHLKNRLDITAWRKEHPEVGERTVERPLVIVGQPRTATTILYDLLAQDPTLRVPLTWEVDRPCPAPEPATYDDDPRADEVDATLQMADLLIPGFTDFHPMGARLGQECVRITGGDFRSMIFPTQYRVPSYNRWLLHEADLAPAYRYHRRYLEHLQSRMPAEQWLLKSPAHLWHLDALIGEYPDALIVQTHRDPLKVIASVTALVAHLRQMAADPRPVAEIAPSYVDDVFAGLDRGMEARDRGVIPDGQVVDVHFTDFVDDPLGSIADIYARLGKELTPEAEARMRSFLAANPGDGGGGGTRYRFADTGLDIDALRERSTVYQERFGVLSEPVR